ncbi:MAG: restriction endonuclease subunit S, partial [Neisseriaceae bacterium]|nr:restriction endonuclease subunit S [Neisseriaceae bacterium]
PLKEYQNFLSGSLKEDSPLFNNETFNEYRQKIKKSTVYKNLAKKKTSTQTDLQRLICNEILSIEKTKFIYFMLICNQQTLITKSPTDNKEQSKFLGYEWSNRKGSEGIKYLNFPNSNDEDEDEITETSKALQSINTALYDPNENPNDEQTLNPNKLNFWIRQNFIQAIQKDTANLSGSLKNSEASKYAQMVYLRDCIDFKKAEFDLAINLSAQSKIEIESKYPLVKLDSVLLFIRNGKNVNQIDEVGKYKVARIETIANAIVDTNAVKYTNDEVSNEHFFDYGDIILSHINSLKHLGKTAIFDIHEKLIHGINILRLKPNQEKILPIYLFRLTKTEYFKNEILTYCSKAVNQSSINITNLKNIQIPLPPLEIQQQIVAEVMSVDNQIQTLNNEIEELQQQSAQIFAKFDINKYPLIKIAEISSNIINGSTPSKKEDKFWNSNDIFWFSTPDYPIDNIYIEAENITQFVSLKALKDKKVRIVPINSVLLSCTATLGKVGVNKVELTTNQQINAIVCNDKIIPKFLAYIFKFGDIRLENLTSNSGVKHINIPTLQNIKIPLPPIEVQEQIVAEFEKIENEITARKEKLKTLNGAYNKILDKY